MEKKKVSYSCMYRACNRNEFRFEEGGGSVRKGQCQRGGTTRHTSGLVGALHIDSNTRG